MTKNVIDTKPLSNGMPELGGSVLDNLKIQPKQTKKIVNEILEGVNEEDFNFLLEFLSSFTNKNLTFKELVLSFLTGDFSSVDISFNSFKNSIINSFNKFGGKVIIYLLMMLMVIHMIF